MIDFGLFFKGFLRKWYFAGLCVSFGHNNVAAHGCPHWSPSSLTSIGRLMRTGAGIFRSYFWAFRASCCSTVHPGFRDPLVSLALHQCYRSVDFEPRPRRVPKRIADTDATTNTDTDTDADADTCGMSAHCTHAHARTGVPATACLCDTRTPWASRRIYTEV